MKGADQELRVEKFLVNDAAIFYLTGIPSYTILQTIFHEYLRGKDRDFLDKIEIRNYRHTTKYPNRGIPGGTPLGLNYFIQFFVALMEVTCWLN